MFWIVSASAGAALLGLAWWRSGRARPVNKQAQRAVEAAARDAQKQHDILRNSRNGLGGGSP
jgi:hypothetical protein